MTSVRSLVCFALLAAGFANVPSAHAVDLSMSAGRSTTSAHRWTNVVFFDATGATHDADGLHWQPAFTLGWVGARQMQTEHLNHAVVVGAGGVRLVDWWRHAFFSFQVGLTSARTDALSSEGEFVSTLGWQGEHWQVMVRHISNGHLLGGKNLGETMLLAGVNL